MSGVWNNTTGDHSVLSEPRTGTALAQNIAANSVRINVGAWETVQKMEVRRNPAENQSK